MQKIRKEYEAGKIKDHRYNMREYTFRTDGCSNTITTVQKDNYIAEINNWNSRFIRRIYE